MYKSNKYLKNTNNSWHSEDSAWKAKQIFYFIRKHSLNPKKIVEVGCGAGGVLAELAFMIKSKNIMLEGYDISPKAIALAKKNYKNCKFICKDLFSTKNNRKVADLLLVIDVIEHVSDLYTFLNQCKKSARFKIYHIPLDIHLSSVLRNSFLDSRYTLGHIHYFTAESAIAALKDSGHRIIDFYFTSGSFGVLNKNKLIKTCIGNIFRLTFFFLGKRLSARVFGGYSLLVLTK